MMEKYILLIILFFNINTAFSQSKNINELKNTQKTEVNKKFVGGLRDLTEEDWIKIEKTPKLIIKSKPKGFLKKAWYDFKYETLGVNNQTGAVGGPSHVDNSTSKAFRPIFAQVGNCCAQASGVAYNFTYEINLLNNTDASKERNCFPSHYTWNILNRGKDIGSWYFDGWSLIMANGCPTIPVFGSLNADKDHTFWMSGYDKYQDAMDNTILSTKTITINTWDGVNTLRNWLFDRGTNAPIGGLANFGAYAQDFSEHEVVSGKYKGKKLISAWGPTGGHAMTIVGYDDEISFDYNGDGKYTIDEDINGDGIIDLKDSEVGAFIVANTWGTWWGNDGFTYMMYKLCGEEKNDGGLMSRSVVHVIDKVESNHNTKVDKIINLKVKFDKRGSLGIGLAYDKYTNAIRPSRLSTHMFPTLKNKGGQHAMRGEKVDADLPIEISLDVSKVKEWFPNYTGGGKFFLVMNHFSGTGEILDLVYHDLKTNISYKPHIADPTITKGNFFVAIDLFEANHVRLLPEVKSSLEVSENDGSLSNDLSFKLKDADFRKTKPEENTDYQVENLPDGLSLELSVENRDILKVKVIGKATNNEKVNSASVKIVFNDSMFRNLREEDLGGYKQEANFNLVFRDKYQTKYLDIQDAGANKDNLWKVIKESATVNYKLNLDADAQILCDNGSSNIKLLNSGDIINSASYWIDSDRISSMPTSNVDGKYIGLKIKQNGEIFFAWLLCKQSATSGEIQIADFAYFTKALNPILAGLPSEALLKVTENLFLEDESTNYGAIKNTITCKLYNANFSLPANSSLTEGTHYYVENLPIGLYASLSLDNSSKLSISIKGKTESNLKENNTKFNIIFKNELFSGLKVEDINGSKLNFDISFQDPFRIIKSDSDFKPFTCSANDSWHTFRLKNPKGDYLESYIGFSYYTNNITIQSSELTIKVKPGDENIAVVNSDDLISIDDKEWFVTSKGSFPFLYYQRYTDWKGKDAYVGIIVNIDGKKHLGWIHIYFSPQDMSVKVISWAYNEQPSAPIVAGAGAHISNFAPVADAGPNQRVRSGQTVVLDAGKSYDANTNTRLTYKWTSLDGIVLSNVNKPVTSFNAPDVTSPKAYNFEVEVSDGELSSTSKVNVTVDIKNKKINKAPVANAGENKNVKERSFVKLSALKSYDDDANTILTYSWKSKEGIFIIGASSATPSFTAPMVDKDTDYNFILTVSDGTDSSTANLTITVENIPNEKPLANAGGDIVVKEGEEALLIGEKSFDKESYANLSYAWTNKNNIFIKNDKNANASFIAPLVDEDTVYVFYLEVSDGEKNDKASINVRVINNTNRAPIAIAGSNQNVKEGSLVKLRGNKSYDEDQGDNLTYLWISKSNIKIHSSNRAIANFMAPRVEKDTEFDFELRVSDGSETSSSKVSVMVENIANIPPVSNAGENKEVNEGGNVKLFGDKSYDEDSESNLTYTWTTTSDIIINNANEAIANFKAPLVDSNTEYIFDLEVSDGQLSHKSQVTITVKDVFKQNEGSNITIADAGADLTVKEFSEVILDASNSFSNVSDVELKYTWTNEHGIKITDANNAIAKFKAPVVDKNTEFTFKLEVNDGDKSYFSTMLVSVENVEFTANAGDTQTVLEGDRVTLSGIRSVNLNLIENEKYIWSSADGIIIENANSLTPTFIAPKVEVSGEYEFVLTILYGGQESRATTIVKVLDAKNAFISKFEISKYTLAIGQDVSFKNKSKSNTDITNYQWTFEGGLPAVSTDENPNSVKFDKAGVYKITLVITDSNGQKTESTKTISVSDTKPEVIADFTSPKHNVVVGREVLFTNSSQNTSENLKYKWVFLGGVPRVFNGKNPPLVTYKEIGKYDVTLTITDEEDKVYNKTLVDFVSVDVLSSVEDIKASDCFIYPNPATTHFYINKALGATAYIYSINGLLLKTLNIKSDKFKINLAGFSSGSYIIKALSDKIDFNTILIVQ